MSNKTYRSPLVRSVNRVGHLGEGIRLAGLVILIGVVGYVLSPTLRSLSAPTSRSQPNHPIPDPTAGWQTYTNKGYSYQIRYPSNVRLYQHPGNAEVDFYFVGDVNDDSSPDDFLYTPHYWYRRLQILYRGPGGIDGVEKAEKAEGLNRPSKTVAFNNVMGFQMTDAPLDYFLTARTGKSVTVRIAFGYTASADTVPDFQSRLKVYTQMLSTFRFIGTP